MLWDQSINLRGGLGYKDNILLSPFTEDESMFWETAADYFLFRASNTPAKFHLFLSGEDRRYFSSESVDKEQLVLAFAKAGRTFGENWEAGTELEYYYLDQVVDASATETIFLSFPVKSHSLGATPYLLRELPKETWAELRFEVNRQIYNEPLDDYWEAGPEVVFGKRYGYRSSAELSYAFRERAYDTRRHVALDFGTIPDTSLRYQQHEVEVTFEHSWDEARHWRSRLRSSYERNEDNGPGFFDYNRWRVAKRLRFVGESWEASIEGKFFLYDYARQPLLFGNGVRQRTEYGLSLRVEKALREDLLLFAKSEHDWSRSNSILDEYTVNMVMTGVDWEF